MRFLILSVAALSLCSCVQNTNNAPVQSSIKSSVQIANQPSLVLSDGIEVTQAELTGRDKYVSSLDKTISRLNSDKDGHEKLFEEFWKIASSSDLSKEEKIDALTNAKEILQLGAVSKSFKNDDTMQAILSRIVQLKSPKELILLSKIIRVVSDNEMALTDNKNLWLCRLTRSTIWLSSVQASQIHGESGTQILSEIKKTLEPMDSTESRDFTQMENAQKRL